MVWYPHLQYNAISCRYNEIGTKGRNRLNFERHLVEALERRLSPSFGTLKSIFEHGRIFLTFPEYPDGMTAEQLEVLRHQVPTIPGIASLSPGFLMASDIGAIHSCVMKSFPKVYQAFIQAHPNEMEWTYAMRVNRSHKGFAMRSAEMEQQFARELLPGRNLKVDLAHGNLRIDVDIRFAHTFVDYERIPGPGGLPTGSGGTVLALLSGGFDSPVACYEMMRRGCNVDFITFHSSPYTPPATLTKVCRLACRLNEFQKRGRLIAVNLLPVQKAIRDNCSERNRTVLYRRCMMRLAAHVAEHLGDGALLTGENFGQVASQTMGNMSVIDRTVSTLILRPLLTFDKADILKVASQIGTFDISIEQVPDSCTVFAPHNPATNASIEAITADEETLELPALLRECLEKTVIMNATTYAEHPFTELLDKTAKFW